MGSVAFINGDLLAENGGQIGQIKNNFADITTGAGKHEAH